MPPSEKKLGKYSLSKELGRGGMGVVYEAVDTELQRKVALKLLLGNSFADAAAAAVEEERFIREAQLSAKLKHPNIVTVYEAGMLDGKRYLAMQLVEGTSLAAWLRTELQAGIRQKVIVLRDVALAVAHAHDQGVFHRDLKPQNVLLDDAGKPYVTDFGLAKRSGHDATASLTVSGAVVGTPSYMSPEQARGLKTLDARSDVYSLGVMLYEMLAGRTPFMGDTPIDILMKVVNHPAPPPSQVAKKWQESASTDAIENICLKAMAKDPRQRFSTARAFAEDLGRWLKGKRPKASAPASPGVPTGVWVSIAAAAAAALAVVFAWPSDRPAVDPPKKTARPAETRPESDAEKERLAREKQAAADETDRVKRQASKDREESLLREADRVKRSEAEKETLAAKLREAEERARAAEEEARKAKLTPPSKPVEPAPVKPADPPARPPEPAARPEPAVRPEPVKVPPSASPVARKLPEPSSAEQKSAEKSVQARFKEDYAKKMPSERRALAVRLLELGRKEDPDTPARYALLQEARELASQNGDPDTSVGAVEALVRTFQLDAKGLRSQTLLALAKAAVVPTALKEAGAAGLRFAADAVAEDDHDAALQLLAQCDLLAKRAKDPGLQASVQDRVKDVTEIRKEWGHVRASFKTLQEKPDDPACNTAAGRFLCFVKQEWERGLPYLARGDAEALRTVALRELTAAMPEQLLETGEAWSALPEKQASAKARIADHAVALYKRAWPGAKGAVREGIRAKFKALAGRPGRVTPGLTPQWQPWQDALRDPFGLDDGCAHGGRVSARISAAGKAGGLFYWPVRRIPVGRACTLSAWILTDGSEAVANAVFIGTSDGVNPGSARSFGITAPTDQPWWVFVQTTLTVPPDTLSMNVYINPAFAAGTIWIDDLSVKLDDGTELMENGGFEK